MSIGGHARQTLNKGVHSAISWTFADATARGNFTVTEGIPANESDLTSDDLYKLALQLDDDSVWLLNGIGPTTWVAFGGLGVHSLGGGAHTASTLAELNALISDATLHDSGTGGSVHANATTSVAGFMSATDKTKIDTVASNAAALTATAPVNVTKDTAAVGVGTTAARHDHKHDIATTAPAATGVATTSGEGSSTSLARADHTHQSNTAPVNVTKAAAAIGTSGEPARADHKHDVTTATAGAVQAGAAAAEGSATSLARSDHAHSVAVATPSTIGTANSAGAATTFVRGDHVHAHGNQTSGTLHAAATTSVNGFMSAADKTKLDAIPAGSSGQVQYHNGSGGLAAEAGFEYDAAGNQLTVPGLTVTEGILFTGVISPTSLASSQNNYAPTGFATASTIRLTSSTSVNITGLAGGTNGRFIILHNIGSNNIVLVNSSGSSTAANQFLFNGNITLGANQSVTLRYDGTSSRWRATGGSGASVTPFRKVYAAYDFLTPVTNYAVNASAGYAADTANAALFVRRFDDTTQEGVGFGLSIPAGMANLTLYFKSRAQSTPGGTVGVQPILYFRTIPDNASVSSWSAGTQLTPLSFPTNTNWQYDSQTLTLASLSLTAGNYVQFELTRDGADGDDTLAGDWTLLEMTVEFT